MNLGYTQLDRHLITALIDRWRPETSTFHLPVGEMTVTLADVAVLLGLPIEGNSLALTGENYDYLELCHSLLGLVPPPPEETWGNEMVQVRWFREALANDISADATEVEIEQRARAIILHIITSRLMCDHSKNRVNLRWLPYITDLGECGKFSWGSAVLCYTYMEMSRLSLLESKLIGGCLTLLQLWSWTYLPVGRITVKNTDIDRSLPLGSRWIGPKSTIRSPRRNAKFYRNELDVLEYASVNWSPYSQDVLANLPEICSASRYLWTVRVPLICLKDTANHSPDRVMRQFGMSQHIPEAAAYYRGQFDVEQYNLALNMWNQRHTFTEVEREPTISLAEYNRWYWNITRRYVLKAPIEPITVNPYTPRAPLERNVADGIYAALEELDKLEEEQVEERSKGRCLSIKKIMHAILGKNKLSRPKPPSPPAPPAPITYRRRPREGGASSSQTTSTHEEYIFGPSQPPSTAQQTDEIEEEDEEDEEDEDEPQLQRPSKRTPNMLRRLRN